jgi:hypothetical protein
MLRTLSLYFVAVENFHVPVSGPGLTFIRESPNGPGNFPQKSAQDRLNEELLEMFPDLHYSRPLSDFPDFTTLSPDDPLFLDMPWPTERGPEATAFTKHLMWKRKLSDGESKQLVLLSNSFYAVLLVRNPVAEVGRLSTNHEERFVCLPSGRLRNAESYARAKESS